MQRSSDAVANNLESWLSQNNVHFHWVFFFLCCLIFQSLGSSKGKFFNRCICNMDSILITIHKLLMYSFKNIINISFCCMYYFFPLLSYHSSNFILAEILQGWEQVQGRTTNMVNRLNIKTYEDWLKDIGRFDWQKIKLRGNIIAFFKYMKSHPRVLRPVVGFK